jgi:AcrR family transcriptional regulator
VEPVRQADAGGPGRPRDPSIEDRVIEAAKRELAERGFEAFSMRSVARLAGVARPSLLLRWPSRDALIIDTLERLAEWPTAEPADSVRVEIDAIVAQVAALMEPEMLGIQLRLIADAAKHHELYEAFQHKVIAKAGARLTRLLEHAVEDGELRSDTDTRWFADALIGVVFMRTIRAPGLRPPSHSAQRRLVDTMWTALRR